MRTRLLFFLFSFSPLVVPACAAPPADDGAETSEHAASVFAPDLWAGLPSITLERWAADPCNDGRRALGDEPVSYDSWVRQRAAVRNVCFEVWKPGVTDAENPDFWRILDVQVHYRYAATGAWKTAYVPAIDRRGNNRRYAWALSYDLDPVPGGNVADARAPFAIVSETARSAEVRAELELFFTVNGHELTSGADRPFRIAYTNVVEKPSFEVAPGGNVLYPEVTCAGLRLGGAAGYFAADVTDQAAVDLLGAGVLAGTRIDAARVGVAGSGASRVLSVPFGSRDADGRYFDGYGAAVRAEAKPAGAGKIALTLMAYDRAAGRVEPVSYTFDGCTSP